VELKDRVEQISALIADLRQSSGDGPKSRELIDSLFRAVHSFKAAASAGGRHDASAAAHQFENLLHSLRTGELTLNNHVLEACEQSAAGLLEGTVVSSFDSFTIGEIYKTSSQTLLPHEFDFLRDEERHRAEAAIQEGSNLHVMEVVFEVIDFDERFRQLKESLVSVAELISTSATFDDDKIIFKIVYAAKTGKFPVQTVFRQAALAGESLAAALNKTVEFVRRGEESLLEQSVCEGLGDVLLHLVRNAVDHGIESNGTVVLEATTTPDATVITVTDDGRGIAPENLPLVFQPSFTTATELTEFSGRGVGLDVVKTSVEDLGGSVSVISEPGKGSSFQIMIPNPIKMQNLS
jgi:two-component system chemotaxis sensor kinase CheA